MGTGDRKLILTGMVALGTVAVWGLATWRAPVAIASALGVAFLALVLIWSRGEQKDDAQVDEPEIPGLKRHGGCLTTFVLVWGGLLLAVFIELIVTPVPDPLVNWDRMAPYGELLSAITNGLFSVFSIACLIGIWVWWKKWCVVGFFVTLAVDLLVEGVGRVVLGPPPIATQSSQGSSDLTLWLFIILVYGVFAVLTFREWALFD